MDVAVKELKPRLRIAETLDSRHDELESDWVKPIPSDAFVWQWRAAVGPIIAGLQAAARS
jgi:hypothetical protein